MKKYAVIGKSVPQIAASAKATGEARYAGDVSLPGLLHGKILRSPLPHARILHVDVSRALRLVGVKAVATGQDTLGIKVGGMAARPEFRDRQGICVDRVRYIGDAVAAVAAVDEDTAQEAIELVRVEYEELPAVYDPRDAMAPGAPRLHDHAEDNCSISVEVDCGDVDEALSRAYHVRTDAFITQPVNHGYLEPHTAVAMVDANGKLTVWSSTQAPYFVRNDLAKTLGLPPEDIRVIKPHVGGGFGGKLDGMDAADFCAAVLSRLSGHPVRIAYGRDEEFVAARRRHPTILEFRTGVDRDGLIVGKESKLIFDGGAYNSLGQITCVAGATRQFLPYRLQNLRYQAIRVYTNKAPCGAMRGFGIPQIHFGVEAQLDMIAEDLGIDPVEIRLRNALRAGDSNPRGYVIGTSGLSECISVAADRVGWKEKREQRRFGRGVGIGCSGNISGPPTQQFPAPILSGARVRYNADGTATVFSGAADIGQGSDTLLCQVAAEELGLRFEDMHIVAADTALAPLDQGTYGSRLTMIAGNAVKRAAAEAKRQLIEVVADRLEANPNDLEVVDGRVQVKGSPDRSLLVAEAVKLSELSSGSHGVLGEGSYTAADVGDRASPAFSFEAQALEVEVDTATGQITVLNSVIVHDCGTVVNPLAVGGQLEGSVVMGMGYALSEDVIVEDGRTLTTSLLDYAVPTALDAPPIVSATVGSGDPEGPYGAKEAGEGTLAPFPPALVNAVYDAIGVRITELPVTPEKILQALEKRAAGKPG